MELRNVEYKGFGKEEEELLGIARDKGKMKSKPKDAENHDEFVERFLLIPQALKVLFMLNSEHISPYSEWIGCVRYLLACQILDLFSFVLVMTHRLSW